MAEKSGRVPRLPTLREVETAYIVNVLAACGGSKPAAARVLGISTKTVYNKLAAMAEPEPKEA